MKSKDQIGSMRSTSLVYVLITILPQIIDLQSSSKCDYFILEIVLGTTREESDKMLQSLNIQHIPDIVLSALWVGFFTLYTK